MVAETVEAHGVPTMSIGVLGPVRVRVADQPVEVTASRCRTVLAALAVSAGQAVPMDGLAATVWDGEPPPSAPATLRNYVKRLRRLLGPAAPRLATTAAGYRFSAGPDELDLLAFLQWRDATETATRSGDWVRVEQLCQRALALWRGPAMVDVACPALHRREVPRLDRVRMQILEWQMEAGLRLGHGQQLIEPLYRLVGEHPLHERFHAQLMAALAAAGRRAEALDAYRAARRVLVEDLGIEPGPELQAAQREILRCTAPPAARTEPAQVPAPTPQTRAAPLAVPRQLPGAMTHFSGRYGQCARLSAHLERASSGEASRIIAIDGMAGVGKTTLALHWAHQVAKRFPDGQLYLNLRGFDPSGTPITPAEAVRGFLDALGVAPARTPPSQDALVGMYRSLLADRRTLIVLDNALNEEQVRPLLPAAPGCLVLITSRSQLTGLAAADGACLLSLDVLGPADAEQLLAARVGAERAASESEAVGEIASRCGGLPLALAVTAARASARPSFPLAALAADLSDAASRLDVLDVGDPAVDVRGVFSWSYRQLAPAAATLFRRVSQHPGTDITVPAAASLAAVPLRQARHALRELAGAHLLIEQSSGRYSCHDLLRAYAADLADSVDSEPDRYAAATRLRDHYLHTAWGAVRRVDPLRDPILLPLAASAPGSYVEPIGCHADAMAWLRAEHSTLLAVLNDCALTGADRYTWQFAWTLDVFLRRQGHWHDQIAAWRAGSGAAERLDHRGAQAYAQRRMAVGMQAIGRPRDALNHLQRALSAYRRAGDQAGQANTHYQLAGHRSRIGCPKLALSHARLALTLWRAARHTRGEALALNAVGWHSAQLGDYAQTLLHCGQALALAQATGDRGAEAATWDSLGYAHHHLGDRRRSTECYERAIALYREIGDRYYTADALAHFGAASHAAGDWLAASQAWQQALAVLDEMNHPDADEVRHRLRELEERQRR
jgi:DNA-binding SARP family transcriptional activator/tetratricopeptide (TPR) repeat protein